MQQSQAERKLARRMAVAMIKAAKGLQTAEGVEPTASLNAIQSQGAVFGRQPKAA